MAARASRQNTNSASDQNRHGLAEQGPDHFAAQSLGLEDLRQPGIQRYPFGEAHEHLATAHALGSQFLFRDQRPGVVDPAQAGGEHAQRGDAAGDP
ncbi:hypothetical protein R6U49_19510 [Pseudomonas aeruginosa]|nr:hypothetical protein [Pseudomonas aeruginosa]WRH50015.1 hypothetical protein R6U49_19510 [Pseudomonas aeruginosa]